MKMLPRKDGGTVKRMRIQQMHTMLKGVGDMSLKRFLSICSYNMGLTAKTTMKYLRDLEMLGFVELDEANDVVREVVEE